MPKSTAALSELPRDFTLQERREMESCSIVITADNIRRFREAKARAGLDVRGTKEPIPRTIPRNRGTIDRAIATDSPERATHTAIDATGVRITLPWSALLPDNRRTGVAITRSGDEPRPFVGTTKVYRLAKKKAVEAIEEQLYEQLSADEILGGYQPLFTRPVAITVTLIEPNRSHRRDLLNYQKLICDAMSGFVYADDSLIDDAHFTRGTPDIDRPRVEIHVRPFTETR